MTLDEDDDDHGYAMSAHVAALIESEEDEEATVRAFIADIFTQRIRSHHARAMEGPRFSECLDRFIERAPQIIEVVVITIGVESFSIQQVQRITDDLVELEDREFVARYGLEELFAALTEAQAAGERDPETPYEALARHLRPDDPAAGAREVDQLILLVKRFRGAQHNRRQIVTLAAPLFLAIGLTSLGLPALFHAIEPATPLPLPTPPPGAATVVLALGVGLLWRIFQGSDVIDPPLPAAAAQWLAAHDRDYGLRSWDELYWPTAKRLACERTFLGFDFWKKVPPPESEWPEIRCADPEWDYWEHGPGKPVSARYYRPFMARIERWDHHASRVLLGCLVLVIGAALADTVWSILSRDHIGLFANPSLKVGVVLVAMLLTFALAHGGLPRLRWLPRALRRHWFGPLPADAEAYRDYLLGRT
ncbi:hypothetical protein B2G71_19350 [Novosphingobium sp. PC22D]|uniref:Uncharacterized protein n=1 Tax=Novosphingobium indicum TaxID=462949 RepID=A0ABQ2JW38_9SPHN|nr:MULTISPECIES: hypothetical protein [Novosphingobium]PEQ10976.1 hypothetical protein B2G71_19350 [Novosphingobium sp. PC22D]GGN55900.1 hypothetical protein GCM10011349_33060 [Novosphingobium indicum]